MTLGPHIVDVAHVIQLSVAPVFLLSGVGVMLTVFTNRLARIVDRARALEERLQSTEEEHKSGIYAELTMLSRRSRWNEAAIGLTTVTGLLISVVIVALFVDDIVAVDLSGLVALLFILAMVAFVAAFISFLREIVLATVRIRTGPG
jgi:ABC-type bacteriocin/lantibiotic exporter with double-glycine peptidase domain